MVFLNLFGMIARTSCKKIRRVQLVGKLFGPRYNELNAASMKDLLGLIQAYIVRKYCELNSVAPDNGKSRGVENIHRYIFRYCVLFVDVCTLQIML